MRLALLGLLPALVSPLDPTLALVDVSVVDVEHGVVLEHHTILLEGDRIRAVGPHASTAVPAGATVIASGGFVLPGLVDMHVHLTDATEIVLPVLVAHGVTTVRDMGGDLELIDAWRAAIEAGERVGPRIHRAGPYVDGRKPGLPFRVEVATPEEARAAVGELAGRGVDLVKVHNGVPREAYLELARAARERGLAFAGHVPLRISPLEAVRAGQRSLEHVTTFFESAFVPAKPADPRALVGAIDEYMDAGAAPLLQALREAGTWVTPNLVGVETRVRRAALADHPDPRTRWIARSLREQWDAWFPVRDEDRRPEVIEYRSRFVAQMLRWTKELADAGVPLLLGTDLALRDVFPGASVLDELALLERAGLTRAQCLRAATLEPARCLGRAAETGTIAPGKLADLVVLSRSPLESLDALGIPAGVVARGVWHPRAELDSWLDEAARLAPTR